MTEENEETTLEEVDVEFFEFIQLNKNVTRIRLSEDVFDEKTTPYYSSLLAVSNLYGYFVAGTSKGFIYASTKDLRKVFSEANSKGSFSQGIHIDIPEGRVHFLRLTLDQLTIVVGIEGGQALYYDVTKFSTKPSEIRPYQIMKFSNDIMDIRPNPGEKDNVIAFLLVSGAVYFKDFKSNEEIGSIQNSKVGEQITAICWSQKGKQLVCGNQSGKLERFTPEGDKKDTYQAPPTLQQPAHCVRNILWLESPIFIVTYYPVVQDENSEHVVYVVSRENKSKTVYSKVTDICFPGPCEKSSYMFMESIKGWGSDLKNAVIFACTNSSDTSLIGRNESNEWSNWNLSETARAIIPYSEISENDTNETLPIGMALDLSSTENWVTKLTGDEDSQMPPVPILFIYNDYSEIIAYRCFQKNACKDGISCPGMTISKPIPATGPSAINTTGPSMLKNTGITTVTGATTVTGTTTVGAQMALSSVKNSVSAPIATTTTTTDIPKKSVPIATTVTTTTATDIPKNNVLSLSRPNNLNNIAITAVGSNAQNAPLKNQVKPTSTSGPDAVSKERLPHIIRLEATKKSVQEIQILLDDIEKKYLVKYHERTNADSLEDPNDWSIGDFPVIISETKRLEKVVKNIIESLGILKQETTDLNLNFVKEDAMTKQEIGLLVTQKATLARRGTIQSRITEKYGKAFQNVRESADALEEQLNTLHEQIKDHKANKFAGQPPLEYIDRSIKNISKGLYSNESQIEQLNTQLDLITEQLSSLNFNKHADDFVYQQIEHETRKSTIPVKCSDEAEEKTNQIMKKEWKLFNFLNINKSKRKVPYETNLFSDIEPVQSYTSPKLISPRKSQSPIKTRSLTQMSIEKPKPIEHDSPLRNSFSIDEESDYSELDTPIRRNTYTEFDLPTGEDTDEVSQKYSRQVSEIRERRLRYFEKERDDVRDDVYSDDGEVYEHMPLRGTRVRFQEPFIDDSDEIIEDSIHQKFERIVGSSRTNDDYTLNRVDRLQIDSSEDDLFEPQKFSDINNLNISDYFVSSPESPKTEDVSYSPSNEQKDNIASEQSSTAQDSDEESLDINIKIDKIVAAEISSIENQYYNGEESKSDIEAIERLSELEKTEEIIEPAKEKVESTALEEISQVTTETTAVSEVGRTSQQPEKEEIKFGSFGLQPSFGAATSTPEGKIPNAFNIGSSSIPPAFAAPPPNVNAFNQTPQSVFGQPSFGGQLSQIPNAFAAQPAFGQTGFGQQTPPGQTGFGQPTFGQPAFGQPAFGQSGFGQPAFGQTGFGTPSLQSIKTPSDGGGFARFASGGRVGGFGSASITSTSANKPFNTPSTSPSSAWSEMRK